MKNYLILPFLIFIGLLQAVFPHYLRLFNIGPDLLFVSVVTAGLTMELKWAVMFGLLAGLLKDSIILGSFGINTLMFTLWGFLIAQISRKISIDDNFRRFWFCFIAALLYNIFCAAAFFYSGKVVPLGVALRIILIGSAYTALISPVISKVILRCIE
jgi:rod shape-determining protein MreD